MTTKTVILMGKPVTLRMASVYVDEKDRLERARNVASFLKDNWETLSGIGKSISSKRLRDLMIECLGNSIKDSKGKFISDLPIRNDPDKAKREIRAGDDRGHGDTVGGHCLMLECQDAILTGKRAKVILLNEKNKEKIDLFLSRISVKVVDVIS
jgi:hypothetical protein